ncbi:MAG: M1 family aminopeptidase [Bacteroidales bacterium]|nr:M1 family aminopeptidase [Bacteroidales bacterium]
MRHMKMFVTLVILALTTQSFAQIIHHQLYVNLSIANQSIVVTDSVTIPFEMIEDKNSLVFSLNQHLNATSLDGSAVIKKLQNSNNSLYNNYLVEFTHHGNSDLIIPIKYAGVITGEIAGGAAEYARGFSETSGMISDSGAYLAGSTFWIPAFNVPLLTYNLTVTLRSDWNVVSQGDRTVNEVSGNYRVVTYQCDSPTEEIYLISAGWTGYEQKSGDILVQAFLRTPDQELAKKYLDATSGYLSMYVDLVGPYPYHKFALVENFWETGYGMPSFTLLGEKVIRFPFILYTSYPHELLHNWWGNSVYVDYTKGNWCEGITAYMADHLMKEQTGQGADYRRTTLQKFADYVNPENDFPVTEFRSRNNAAEEAIGYGKVLMFNHMLRKKLGDNNFVKAYQSFYNDNIFQMASFDDIRNSFQPFSETDLKQMFDQWLKRKGAPALNLSNVSVKPHGVGYELSFSLSQTQTEDIFEVDVPVAVYLEDKVEIMVVNLNQRSNIYTLRFSSEPVKIEIDPQFDVFRRLDKAEVPPALSQIFGSIDAMIILPKGSPFKEDYSQLADTWKQTQEAQGKSLLVVWDDELETIPTHTSAWVLGFENKFAGAFDVQKKYATALDSVQSGMIKKLSSDGSLVYAIPNPEDGAYAIGFVGTHVQRAIPGLTRLLPHYGKYSFLGFEGERPNNVLKGNFPALNSPLFYSIPYNGKYLKTSAIIKPEKALIE